MDINFEILPLVSLKHNVVASHESFCKNLVDYFRQAALATVYRALEGLKTQGTVKSRTLSNGEAIYSVISHEQHHVICVSCGQSFVINECPVHDLEKRLEKTYNFQVYYHTLEFFGRCHECNTKSVL